MNHESKVSGDAQIESSNVIRLHGVGNAVTPLAAALSAPVLPGRLPDGYVAAPDGIYHLEQDEAGDEHPVWICGRIEVVGLSRRVCGTGWGRVVDIVDSDGQTHRRLIDEALFSGASAALLRPLLDCGLRIGKGSETRKQVADFLGAWRPQERFLRVSQTGWVDDKADTFVLANGSVIGRKKSILERDSGSLGQAAVPKGSLRGGQEEVAAKCVGNPLMLLALSQAFAGPVLQLFGLESGGFHFRGASSKGKTTLLGLAASVWGGSGYVQSWRATDNALETVASGCSGGLLALNELHEVSPQVAGEIVYMLANGKGKSRMTSSGSLKSSDTWTIAILSSGEISLADHIASVGKKIHAGQEIRFVDIEADGRAYGAFNNLHGEATSMAFVDKLNRSAAIHHGHAGKVFVEQLIESTGNREQMLKIMSGFVDKAIKVHDLERDAQVLRVLKKFAVAALAGEMATRFGVTGWTRGEAFNGVLESVNDWLKGRDEASASQIAASVERTRNYLGAHLDRFEPIGSGEAVDGWQDDAWIYFRPETWLRIHGSHDAQQAARLHKTANLLKTDKGDTLQFRMGRSTPGRPKAYAVSITVLEA
jgi:putative DNA primase/helicase